MKLTSVKYLIQVIRIKMNKSKIDRKYSYEKLVTKQKSTARSNIVWSYEIRASKKKKLRKSLSAFN